LYTIDALSSLISDQWYEAFRAAWYKFIDAHENYFALLESENVRKFAVASYDEQKKRKLKLDAMVTDWRDMVEMSRSSDSKSECKRSKSGSQQVSHVNSNLSIISKKREEICTCAVETRKLKVGQGFEEKEQELKKNERVGRS
jgi:hypothetical protein